MPSSTTFGLTEHLPALLLLAGVSLLTFLVLMNLRFKMQRRAASRHVSPAFASGVAGRAAGEFQPADHLHGGRGSGRNQPATIDDARVVEAHESVRQLINALDTRCKTLEILLRQADDRIRQLEDALDDRVGASISPTRTALPGRARRADDEDQLATTSIDPRDETQPADDPHDSPQVEVTKAGAAFFSGPIDPLTANVYELADRGRSPVEIARYLDEQVGKVELILALRGDH